MAIWYSAVLAAPIAPTYSLGEDESSPSAGCLTLLLMDVAFGLLRSSSMPGLDIGSAGCEGNST